MHPNSGPYYPYSPNNSSNPNVNFTQPQNTYSPYQQSQQGSYLSPPTQHASNRGVYTSMIQPQGPPASKPASGLMGRLEMMGRVVKEDSDPIIKVNEAPTYSSNSIQIPQNNNMLSFRTGGDKPKMSSSVIFPKADDDYHSHFQTSAVQQGNGTSRLDALMKNKPPVVVQEEQTETPMQKRKREIDSIKSQLGKINKRMEHFSFKKPGEESGTGDTKQYFQLPTRKISQQQPSNTSDNSNLNFFKTYSGGNSTANESSGYSSGPTNYSSGNVTAQSHYSNSAETGKQETNYLNIPTSYGVQHSLSDNDLRKRIEPPEGMFKKKSPYQMNPPPTENPGARKFMLSPKANNSSTNMENPSRPQMPVVNEYKAAQFVDIPKPKKGMKRVDSSEKPLNEFDNFAKEPKQPRKFQKSDFVVGKKLGKGQFGQVMLVIHKETGFLCGMKVMSKKQIVEEKYVNQVARELSIQFYLNHRNVSPLYGFFQDKENVYLLVEYATGGQLLQLLRKERRMEDPQCSPIIREICEGLDYIHKEQIIHRDIKPENILFNFDTVKICDFGWAVYSNNGMRSTVAGSPLYYSPEVVQESTYDEKIDIWAIGMMIYECLLGKIPFKIYSQLDLNRIVSDEIKFPEYVDVTDDAKDLILGICQKNPDDRMDMRGILRHPFITKYVNERRISGDILQEFKKVLTN